MTNSTVPKGTRAEAEDVNPFERSSSFVTPAEIVGGSYAADLCATKLTREGRKFLAQLSAVKFTDLVALKLADREYRPTDEDVTEWYAQRDWIWNPPTRAASRDDVRIAVAGMDPNRQISLASVPAEAEWGAQAIKFLRDRNTTARAQRTGPHLTLTVAELLKFNATADDLNALPSADEGSRAASVKIIDTWTEADRAAARRPTQTAARIELTKASDVTREHIDWLWTTEGIDVMVCGVQAALIPLKGLTLVAGREGAAKSLFSVWLSAQVTRGELPGHYAGQPRDVVILATEDTRSTIRMRLEAAGADLDRVHFPELRDAEGIELPISIRDNIDQLADMLATIEPGLIVLDPLKDFLGEGVNTDREQEVRPTLTPLLKLSEDCGAPVVGLHHLNKAAKGDFNSRLTGSGAFKNVARSIIGIAHDEENDIRVLQQKKINLAAFGRGAFGARVESIELTVDGRTESVGRWAMDGVSVADIDAVLAAKEQGGGASTALDRATKFLQDQLGDGKQHPSEEVRDAAAQLQISNTTLGRAFRHLRGKHIRTQEKQPRTLWSLPVDGASDSG